MNIKQKTKKIVIISVLIVLAGFVQAIGEEIPDPLATLRESGADWGIWIENGLVNPKETVHIIVSVPASTPPANLPATLEIHPRYLEDTQVVVELPLKWEKISDKNQWQALAGYRPRQAGNYYASIQFYGHEIFSYFAAWQPGITTVNFWMDMPVEYHDAGDLKDLYLPEARLGHLPFDYELVLVGESVFEPDWKPRELFCRAQVEAGEEVVPFLDGGYFHKLDPEFTRRFNDVTNEITNWHRGQVPGETFAVHGFKKLPDPNFHSLTMEQCSAVIEGAQRYWEEWRFRPFTGVATYSPSDTLVESCRLKGLKWISGVFADYDFTDGLDRWEAGWVQKHRGMPSFPYLISKVDFRMAGKADEQSTMMFPGWQDHPVLDHEDRHDYGTDPGNYGRFSGVSPVQRMMLYSTVFERDNQLADNSFPLAETFCIQMNNPNNHAILRGLIDRARQGNLIFIHKRYLQTYFAEHHIKASPNVTYTIPDPQFTSGGPAYFAFSDEAIWEGADGKAAFISDQTAPLEKGRSIHLPVWWYDYRNAVPLSPKTNVPEVDLSGVTLEVEKQAGRTSLVLQSPKAIDGLPICLWELDAGTKKSAAWIKRNRALPVAAPERMGTNTVMWIIRPAIQAGRTLIPL